MAAEASTGKVQRFSFSLSEDFTAVVRIGENAFEIRPDGTLLRNGVPAQFQVNPAANDGAAKASPIALSAASLRIGQELPGGEKYGGISPSSGKPFIVTAADAPLTMKWSEAMAYAARLEAHGHKGWRRPTKAEFQHIFQHHAEIGGFNTRDGGTPVGGAYPGLYWTSTENNISTAWYQRFSDGFQNGISKYNLLSVRCVRDDESFTHSDI
jgi:hypothetical protein